MDETSDTLITCSVLGQTAGELAHAPPEAQRRRLHHGAGLHGERVHVRAGQAFLPGLVPNGQLLLGLTVCISTASSHKGMTLHVLSCRISSGPSMLVSAWFEIDTAHPR